MERIRGTLITLMCVLFCKHQRIFGTEMKLKVKPGDNVTLYCDCVIPVGSHILWIKNSSFESQSLSLLAEDLFKNKFPRFTFVPNSSSNSYDLHIVNITVYDEGIYYCAQAERKITDENDRVRVKPVYQYGNRRTHLFLLEPVPSESPLPEVTELNCNCWMLLFSVCSVCVLLSSLLSGACVYSLCHAQTTGFELNAEIFKANVFQVGQAETHQCEMSKSGQFCLHSEVTYRLLPSTHTFM